MSNNGTEFEWSATESAPKHYPMEIIKGTFLFKGEADRGVYIPTGGTLKAGWGDPISDYAVGPDIKPLPDRLQITFFSYAEKKLYSGEFDLPYNKILQLFRNDVATNKADPSYIKIMAGVAPGGAVAVWLTGQRTTEVFFAQAKEVDFDPSIVFELPFKSSQQADDYITKQLVNSLSPEDIDSINKNGAPLGLWDRYRNKYQWKPIGGNGDILSSVDLAFVNGEYQRDMSFTKENLKPLPVPKSLSFIANKVIYEVELDEFETITAFEKLAESKKLIHLGFDLKFPRSQSSVCLYTEDESISLAKAVFDDW